MQHAQEERLTIASLALIKPQHFEISLQILVHVSQAITIQEEWSAVSVIIHVKLVIQQQLLVLPVAPLSKEYSHLKDAHAILASMMMVSH